MISADSILAFNYGLLMGVFVSTFGLMYILSRTEKGDYNKSATQRVLEEHCQTIWKYALTGEVSLAQLIHDVTNQKNDVPGTLRSVDRPFSGKSQMSQDPTTINNLSFNANFTKKMIDGRPVDDTLEAKNSVLRELSSPEEPRPHRQDVQNPGDIDILNGAVMELERRGEAWEHLTIEQNRIEELALRVLRERSSPEPRSPKSVNGENEKSGPEPISGIQLLETHFKTRQQECIVRQKEIRKFEAFLGDFGRVYSKFSMEVARLSKEASNIGNALVVEATNAAIQISAQDGRPVTDTKRRYSIFGNRTPKQSVTPDKSDQINATCRATTTRMDGSWKALSVFLSHCSRDNDVISSVIQKLILPKMPPMVEEVAMFEKRLVPEGNTLFARVRECERVYDAKRKERARIHDKLQNSFEAQIATGSERRLTLAMGKMGATPAMAKAAGREAAASSRSVEADIPPPGDASPSGSSSPIRERRTSVIDIMPAGAAPVAAIGMTTTSNVLTMKDLKSNEKLTLQLQRSEEECEELLEDLSRAKESLSEYLPRVFGDFDRIAIKSELELRTHLVLVSQKLEVAHEKGLPSSNRLQAQMGTTRVVDAFGEASGDPDGLDANKDLLRVLHGMVRQRNNGRNKYRHRASSDISIKSNGSNRDSSSSPSVVGSISSRPSPLISRKSDSTNALNTHFDTSSNGSPDSRVRLDSTGSVPLDDISEVDDFDSAHASLDMYAEATAYLAATPLSRLPKLPGSFNDVVGNESAVWFNAVIGRIYRDLSISPYFHNYFCSKTTAALNRGKRPKYIDSFVVSDVTFGSMPPSLCNFCWKPVDTSNDRKNDAIPHAVPQQRKGKIETSTQTKNKKTMQALDEENPDNTVVISADIAFRSGLAFTINTKLRLLNDRMVINIKLHVEVLELTGSCQFGMRHSGSFFTFLEEPHLYVNIRSEVGNSAHFKLLDVPQLSSVIRQKLRSFITKKLVSPNQFVFRLPHPRAWWPKGTDIFFSGHSDKDAAVDPVTGLREVKIKREDSSDDKNMAENRDKRSSDINAKLDVSVKKVITDTENIGSETSHVENRTGRQGSNTTGHIPTEDFLHRNNLISHETGDVALTEEPNDTSTESASAEVKDGLCNDNNWDDDDTGDDSGSGSSDDDRKSLKSTVRKRRDTSVTVEYISNFNDSIVPPVSALPSVDNIVIDTKSSNVTESPRERRRSMFDMLVGNKKTTPAKSPTESVASPEIQISEEILAAARAHMEAADAATYEYESSEDDIGENEEELFKNYVHEAENEEDVFGNINLAAFRRRTVQQD